MRALSDFCPKQSQQKPPPAVQRDWTGTVEQQPDQIPGGAGKSANEGEVLGAKFGRHGSGGDFPNHRVQPRQPGGVIHTVE